MSGDNNKVNTMSFGVVSNTLSSSTDDNFLVHISTPVRASVQNFLEVVVGGQLMFGVESLYIFLTKDCTNTSHRR